MNDEFRTLSRISHGRVPLLETSSAAAVDDTQHCLFQAVAHRSSISPCGGKCGLTHLLAAVLAACWLMAASPAAAQSPPAAKPAPAWQPPRPDEVKAAGAGVARCDEGGRRRSRQGRRDLGRPLRDRRRKTICSSGWRGRSRWRIRQAAKLVALCSEPRSQLLIPAQPWLRDGSLPPLLANNLRSAFRPLAGRAIAVRRGARAAFGSCAGRRGRPRRRCCSTRASFTMPC